MTVLGGDTAFANVEQRTSAWDGIWWAVTTMTTVGFGDFVPVTTEGRLIGIFVMVVGIGFGSLLIGAAADHFVARRGPGRRRYGSRPHPRCCIR